MYVDFVSHFVINKYLRGGGKKRKTYLLLFQWSAWNFVPLWEEWLLQYHCHSPKRKKRGGRQCPHVLDGCPPGLHAHSDPPVNKDTGLLQHNSIYLNKHQLCCFPFLSPSITRCTELLETVIPGGLPQRTQMWAQGYLGPWCEYCTQSTGTPPEHSHTQAASGVTYSHWH